MMNLIKMLAFGLVIFAIAAGGSWFARMQQHSTQVAAGDHAAEPAADSIPGEPDTHADGTPATPAQHGATADDELPVVVRPRMLTPEDILRNAMSLRATEEKLALREQAAQQEKERLILVQADLQDEQHAIESLASDIKEQIDAANQLLARILEEKSRWDSERIRNEEELKKFEDAQTKMNAAEEQNIKQLSTWIQGMDSEAAASFITELSNNGKMDVAVQLLANFEEREASKILAALNNPKLMAELADKFRTLQRPTRTANNRK